MTISAHDGKKAQASRLPVAALFLALFFAAISSSPAMAQVSVNCLPSCTAPGVASTQTTTAAVTALQTATGLIDNAIALANLAAMKLASWIQNATTMIAGIINGLIQQAVANFSAQVAMYVPQVTEASQYQARATMSSMSTACHVAQYEWDNEQITAGALSAGFSQITSNDCMGAQADCGGPQRAHEEFNDLCQLGFLSQTQYGTKTAGCTVLNDKTLIDADRNLRLWLEQKQLAAATPCIQPDGFQAFAPNATNCKNQGGQGNQTVANPAPGTPPSQNQLLYIAAFKYCERLKPRRNTPVAGTGPLNITDETEILNSRQDSVMQDGAYQACRKALDERTAIPQGVTIKTSGGMDAHAAQVKVCGDIGNCPTGPGNCDDKPPTDASGLQGTPTFAANGSQVGMGFNSDPEMKACQQWGLSEMKRKYIVSHPNKDPGRKAVMDAQTSEGSEPEKRANDELTKGDQEWEALVNNEYETIMHGIQSAMMMRSYKTSEDYGTSSPTSR